MKTFWKIVAAVFAATAVYFVVVSNFERAFVCAAAGACAWLLNYRAQVREVLPRATDEAVAAVRHLRPDVVLLDVHMPDGGGAEVLVMTATKTSVSKRIILNSPVKSLTREVDQMDRPQELASQNPKTLPALVHLD